MPSSKSKLIPISYYDPSKEVRLSAYADTVVYEPERYVCALRSIRFGGYPEMVQAMADAIYAGGSVDAQISGQNLMVMKTLKSRFTVLTNAEDTYPFIPSAIFTSFI